MKNPESLKIGQRYRINYTNEKTPSASFKGIGVYKGVDESEPKEILYRFWLEGDDGYGLFALEDIKGAAHD